jgi:hypothetical protein
MTEYVFRIANSDGKTELGNGRYGSASVRSFRAAVMTWACAAGERTESCSRALNFFLLLDPCKIQNTLDHLTVFSSFSLSRILRCSSLIVRSRLFVCAESEVASIVLT